MNKRFLLTLATAIGIVAATTTVVAAPLPDGTKLTIEKTTDEIKDGTHEFFAGPLPGCTNGSCFGLLLYSGLYAWRPLGAGTDGGIIIGKGQKSGEQETNPYSLNTGELTEAWKLYGASGTFFTAPNDAGNVFDDQSCAGAACGSNTTPTKTALKVWNAAWGGLTFAVGSAAGCNPAELPACTADQIAGIFVKTWEIDPVGTIPRKYRLTYNQIIPRELPNTMFELVLVGEVITGYPQLAVTITPANLTGVYGVPIPFAISFSGGNPAPPTCRVGTSPASGAVILDACFSGTYTANIGFIGTDSFTVIANSGLGDSPPATVTAAITAPDTDTGCAALYPVTQATVTGKQGHLTITVTGNLVSVNPNGKEIKICPTTTATYQASTNTPGATVVCQIKSNTGRGQGNVKVNDHIKCTDKPVGNDKINVKIKSGVYRKAM